MEVAPRIRRVGAELINSYIVEEGAELTLVDAGGPGDWPAFLGELAAMKRSVGDVRGLLLTHAHEDHLGYAERARQAGIEASIHEADAAIARGEEKPKRSMVGPYRPIPLTSFLIEYARRGLLRVPPVQEVTTFGDGATLDVPGAPLVVHVPGHTQGSAALHFPGHDAVFSGDAINTYAVTSGRTGPQLSPFNRDRAQALDSIERLRDVHATFVLPGHGAVWSQGVQSALAAVRAAEAARTR